MNSQRKGKQFELRVAKKLGDALGTEPKRSSYHGKWWDDQGVDLMPDETAPFQIQCKAVETAKLIHDTLQAMHHDPTKYNVVIHKRNRMPPLAIMTFDDFCELVQMMRKNGLI